MFRAYLPKLTKSEFHTFVVGSHATIAGFAYGLFVLFGVSSTAISLGLVCPCAPDHTLSVVFLIPMLLYVYLDSTYSLR